MKRWQKIGLGTVVLAALLLAGVFYWFRVYLPQQVAPRSFPQVEGELQAEGLLEPVDIVRDEMGIPHIYAQTMHDLFFAQGYVHAQDRFWQMDFWRHVGSGQLSEMFGESQLDTDKFLRTMGWRQVAEMEYEQLDARSRAILDAYAEGVNAYLQGREPEALSLEYKVLALLNRDYRIQPWTPVDSLVWGKAMAWDLRGNMDNEIARAVLLGSLPPEQVDLLYPPYPQDLPTIVTQPWGDRAASQDAQAAAAARSLDAAVWDQLQSRFQALDALIGETGIGVGSNSWALSGEWTTTGKPMLANDPHLSIQMPSIWYQITLHCQPVDAECPFSVGGFSFAGVPGVIIGHNERVAWGFTNVDPDVMDLYIEKINPDNPLQYEYQGEWVDFETREETIAVAGGEPVTITVLSSRHGPIISDVYGPLKDEVDTKENPDAQPFRDQAGIDLPEHYAIALSWTALRPSTPFEAIWGFNMAQNWEAFRQAASSFHVPAQNLVYADVDGNIGYQMPGLVPIRKAGDGRLPVPGWTGEYDWAGYIPFEDLPSAFNPPEGYIVTANNRVPPWDYPYLITTDWTYGFRAARILDMLAAMPGKVSAEDIKVMQFDAKNMNAERLTPILLSLPMEGEEADVRDRFLASWDYQNRADSQSAAVFAYFWQRLLLDTFADDLPEAYWPEGGERWMQVMRLLIDEPDHPFWDDVTTPERENRDDIFLRAWEETVADLRADYGRDPADWPAWGDLHVAVFRNQTLGMSGVGLIEDLFNRGPYAAAGGKGLVNATGWKVTEGFEVTWLPSMRMIVDLGDLNASETVHTTGQSGHAFHPHYDDMAPLWAAGEYYPMWWDEADVRTHAEGTLRLVP